MVALLGAWLGASAAACDGNEDLAGLTAALVEADRSLAELDAAGFDAAVARAQAVLACLREPVSPRLAASLHRAVGVRAFAHREPIAAAAFAASRRTEPAARLSGSLFPPESPVQAAWSEIPLDSLRHEPLPAPAEGRVTVDGGAAERPAGLPVVFQRLDATGAVVSTVYLLPGEPVPAYPTSPGPAEEARSRRAPSTPLLVTAVASGAAAAGLWGIAPHGRSRYVDVEDPVDDDRLNGLRTRTNGLAVGAVTAAGLCAVTSTLPPTARRRGRWWSTSTPSRAGTPWSSRSRTRAGRPRLPNSRWPSHRAGACSS